MDGAENNLPSFTTNKHYEVCKHFSLDGHTRIPDMLLISTKTWDKLDAEQQQWLMTAAEESSLFQRELWAKETDAAMERAKSEGVQIYEVDTAAFAEKVKPMIDAVADPKVRSVIEAIEQVQ